jgi:hypothetical protein
MSEKNGALLGARLRRNPLFRAFIITRYGYHGDDEAFDRAYAAKLARSLHESKTTDHAVLLALDGIYDNSGRLDTARTDAYIPNDYCRRICDKHPEFLFGPSVNPNRADAIDELVRVKALGAVLVKWLPPSQDFDPADRKYMRFCRKLAELKLPLLSHTGYEHCVAVTNQLYGDPELLVPALNEGVTVIAGHAGTSGRGHSVEFFGRYLEMLDRYPNLYGDLSAITGITRFSYIPAMLKRSGFMNRHFQATDYPAPPMPWLFPGRLGPFRAARLSLKRNIFDCDVETKLALGFPESILTNAASLLGVNG